MVGNIKTIFLTSKDHPEIAKAEIEIQTNCKIKQLDEGLFSGIPKQIPSANNFGYVKKIFLLKKEFKQENFLKDLSDEDINNSYKINIIKNSYSKKQKLSEKEIADKIFKKLSNPKVNLSNPDNNYYLLFLEKNILLLELLDENKDKTNLRKSHNNIHNHPTSMDPKLAKALINISGEQTFHDPFCGTGGIVIEGCLQGKQASGSDIAGGLIAKARINAEKYSLKPKFYKKDALEIEGKFPALITDLPYGRNSSLSEDLNDLYKKFFEKSQTLTNKLIIGMMSSTKHNSLIKNTSWKIKYEFIIYVHKTLSRKMLILEK